MIRTTFSAIAAAAIATIAYSQTSMPKFEVASVKRGPGGGPPGDVAKNMDPSPGHFAVFNVPLRYCVEWAYDIKDYEISGPEWIKSDDRFDIVARAAGPVPEDQLRLMLQSLLAERLQLKTHREPKELNVYVLVRGKGEPKVKEADPADKPTIMGNGGQADFRNQPISRFTFLLSRRLERPVLDETGLKGVYDFTVDISGLPVQGRDPTDESAGPSIFTTVQRDLGLKLEARKQAIPILMIDSVNRVPTEN